MRKVRATTTLELLGGLALLILAVGLSGCGSSSNTNSPSSSVSVALTTKPPATLADNGTAMIAATVTNDSSNAGVDWTCTPATECGTFAPIHTASGGSTTYTAPATAPSGGVATITATSTSTHSATAQATVTITSRPSQVAISITTAPPATLTVGGTTTVSATVTNDTSNAGVDWTCTPAGTCGTFSPTHTASGANTTYTAPGSPVAAVLTATATANPSATVNASVSITAANAAALGTGTYSFYVGGEDSKRNTYAIAGVLVLGANNAIMGGEQDYVSSGGAASPQPSGDTIISGTLAVGANGVGTLSLVTNNSAVGVAGTETFSVAQVNSKHAVINEFDAGATSSGSIDLQTLASPSSLSELNGPFAFTVSGKVGTKAEAFGGLFTSNGAGTLTVTELDSNEGGTVSRGGSNSGTYTATDAAGRGTMTFGGNHFVYYVVSAKVLRIVVVDANEPDLGSAYTGVSGITNASVANSYVFTDASNLSAGATFAAAGKLTMDANGNVTSGFADVDENGTATSAPVSGTYTVSASGYGTITLMPAQDVSVLGLYLTDSTINPTDPNSAAGPGNAGLSGLLLDLDTKLVGSGWLVLPATTTPYTFNGSYAFGTQASNSGSELDVIGSVNVSGTTVTGTEDLNDLFNTGQAPAVPISGTLVPDATNAGRYTISLLVSLPTNPPTLKFVLYQVGTSQFVTLEVDSTEFASGTLQQQQ